jgi:hypothetical protein
MCSAVGSDHPVDAMSGQPPVTHDSLMRVSLPRSSRPGGDARAWPVAALVDEMMALYVGWREHADKVADAYARWSAAPPEERAMRFAAYLATLDQEQATASDYADTIRDLRAVID